MQKKRFGITDIILIIISIVYIIGMLTFIKPCGPAEDGSFMTCHWAGQAVLGIAALLAVNALIHMITSDAKVKIGLDLSMIPAAALAALLPGHLIPLCMMSNMRCQAVMKPGTLIFGILVAAGVLIDLVNQIRMIKKHNRISD